MSIDFGSQWIKIALVKPGVPMEMVLNEESRRKTPNLIIIKDNERLFGDAALAYVSGLWFLNLLQKRWWKNWYSIKANGFCFSLHEVPYF